MAHKKLYPLVVCILSISNVCLATEVKLTGLIYGQYGHYLSRFNSAGIDVKNRGEFAISRVYVTGEAKFTDKLKGHITLESNTTQVPDTGHGSNSAFVKFAYLEHKLSPPANFTLGLIRTPWIGFEETIWGRRFIQKISADQEGLLIAADKGVGVAGQFPKGYGDYHLIYANGEGTTTVEKTGRDGRFKDTMFRLSIAPLTGTENLSKLKLHGYVHQGKIQAGDARRRDRYILALSNQTDRFHLMGSYAWALDGNGANNVKVRSYSLHGSIKLTKPMSLFARYDWYDPNKDIADNAHNRAIFGVDYKLTDGVRLSLNDQILTREAETAAQKDENQLLAQFEVKF